MTDISELVQRIKEAAVRAKTATEEYASGHMSASVCYAECEEFNRLTDGPNNILALTDSLETALHDKSEQSRISCELFDEVTRQRLQLSEADAALEKAQARIAELEARLSPADKIHDSEANAQPSDAIGVFRVGSKSDQEPPVVLTEAVKNLPEGVYWLYATHQPTPGQRQEWMARGAVMSSEQLADIAKSLSPGSSELIKSAARACFILASRIRSGEVDL